jgi:hypothetical protein
MDTLERLYRYRLYVSAVANLRRWSSNLLLQEASVNRISRLENLIVGPRPPAFGQCLSEPVDKAFCKSVERKGIQTAGMAGMATLADTSGQIACGIALEAYRKNAPRRGRYGSLKQIGGALSEELRLAGTRTSND